MKITKKYMEWYALLSLIYCYDENLKFLENSEKPDWQNKHLDIGLEVTEVLNKADGRERAVVNRYFGKGLDGQYIKKEIENHYPEYSSNIIVSEGRVCHIKSLGSSKHIIDKVILTIDKKAKKLNECYVKFKNNWLYVFAPDVFTDDIQDICREYVKLKIKHEVYFDKIFLFVDNLIFVLGFNGIENKIQLPHEYLKKLKLEALKKAEK